MILIIYTNTLYVFNLLKDNFKWNEQAGILNEFVRLCVIYWNEDPRKYLDLFAKQTVPEPQNMFKQVTVNTGYNMEYVQNTAFKYLEYLLGKRFFFNYLTLQFKTLKWKFMI